MTPALAAAPALNPARSVFINCPFDAAFQPLFDAILLATVCCGFTPRSALESGTVAEPRLSRIVRAMFSSRYSIHDLSRCAGEGSENLARFNMPLELGMAMAQRFSGNEHDWLVLIPTGHAYARFVSDLLAYDPPTYAGTVESLLAKTLPWLATRPDSLRASSPREVMAILPAYQLELAQLVRDWQDTPPWPLRLEAAAKAARALPGW